MLIDNVTVSNNTFIGAADGNRDVHPSPQATNITIAGNLPHTRGVRAKLAAATPLTAAVQPHGILSGW